MVTRASGVIDLHDLRIWSLTENKPFAMVHLMINKQTSCLVIIHQAVTVLKKYKIKKVAVQVEEYNPFVDSCKSCAELWNKHILTNYSLVPDMNVERKYWPLPYY